MEFRHHQNRCVPVACSHHPMENIGNVWHKFWWLLLPNRSISHEGSWFFKRRRVNSNSHIIIPRVWFSGAFQVSLAIFKTFLEINRNCMCRRKGWGSPFDLGAPNGADVRSVGFGFWPIRKHDSDHGRDGGFGRHTTLINEPCAIRKLDCIFLLKHTVVRSIECAASMT